MGSKSSKLRMARRITGTAYNLYDSQKWSGSVVTPQTILTNNLTTAPDSIPGWKRRIKNNQSATTSLYGSNYSYVVGQFHVVKLDPPPFQRWSTRSGIITIPDTPTYNSSLTPIADGRAQIEFTKNFHKKTRAFMSGVALAEFRETVGLLASPAKSLRQLTGKLMSKQNRILDRVSIRDIRKALADSWLEYNLAVKPFVSDVNDGAKAIRALTSGRREVDKVMVRGVGFEKRLVSQNVGFITDTGAIPGVPSPGPILSDLSTIDFAEVRYEGAWVSRSGDSSIPTPMLFGLNLSNLVPTIWEATPWSFVIDYFSNIGDVLEACSMAYVDFAWINRNVLNVRTSNQSAFKPYNGNTIQSAPSAQRVSHTYVERTPHSPNFNPKFEFKIPGMGSTKWITLAALLNGSAEMKRKMAKL